MGEQSGQRTSSTRRAGIASAGLIVVAMGLTGCFGGGGGSGGSSADTTGLTTSTTTPSATGLAVRQGAQLAVGACRQYDSAVQANNAHPNPAVAYPSYFTATGEAEGAEKLDPQWNNLAGAFDTVKADIQQINSLQPQTTQPNASPSSVAMLNEDLGLLKGNLIAVDTLCTPVTGASHRPN
jgi:hypothetical protein